MPDPATFDGTESALRPFIAQLQVKLAGNTVHFPHEQAWLAYLFSLLKGTVFDPLFLYLISTGINLPNI
jgi:hypothetical protein